MKFLKSIALAALLAMTGSLSAAIVIDSWTMDDNGTWQTSDQGTNLGGVYKNDLEKQQFEQIDDDETFILAPTTEGQFGGKLDFSSISDLTIGILRLTMSFKAVDWSDHPDATNKVGFRLWDATETNYVALSFEDSGAANKIFAYARTSEDLGDLNEKTGRLVNSLADDTVPRTVTLELDYVGNEVRVYSDNWEWIPSSQEGNPVFTTTVDFASAGMTNVAKFQNYYQNWGTGDYIKMDQITASYESLTLIPEVSSFTLLLGFLSSTVLLLRRRR